MASHNSTPMPSLCDKYNGFVNFDVDLVGGRITTFSPEMDHIQGDNPSDRNAPCGCDNCIANALVFGVIKVQRVKVSNTLTQWMPVDIAGHKAVAVTAEDVRKFYTDVATRNTARFSESFSINNWRALSYDITSVTDCQIVYPASKRRRTSTSTPNPTPTTSSSSTSSPTTTSALDTPAGQTFPKVDASGTKSE